VWEMKIEKPRKHNRHKEFSQAPDTSVRSSGKWNMSRISSGDLPSIIRASARLVRSTNGFNWRLSAADVNSQSFSVSILTNFSSYAFRSYI
jgi:hypothetical protein